MFDTPLHTTDQSIDRVLKAGLPVALIFANGGAGLDATLERLARDNAGKLLVVKVRADENPASVRRFGVGATPAIVAVRDGQAVSQAEGITAPDVERHAASLLGRGPRPEPTPRPEAARAGAAGRTAQAAAGGPSVVTDAPFEAEVLRSPQPVVIDFWAPWCGPCRMVSPMVDRLAAEWGGRVRVAKINVDENPGIAMRYGVQSIPTIMVFKNGQMVDRWAGALPEPALRQRVQQALG